MGKTIQRTSDVGSKLIYRLTLLIAFCGFIFGLRLFAGQNMVITLIFSVGIAVGAVIVMKTLLSLLFAPKSKIKASFEFGESSATRSKAISEFEYEIASLIHKLTGHRTEVVGSSSDGGIDIKVYDPQGELVGIVQCKNLASNKTTHPAYIRDLNMMRQAHQVKTAYLVSKGRFSQESEKLAQELNVKLIDGTALMRLRRQAV